MKFSGLFWIVAIIILIIYGINAWIDIPQVHWSTSKNECVKVIYDGIEWDCSELPEKYERIWVK